MAPCGPGRGRPAPGERVLDLAAGTGTSSEPFAERGASVVPCDFSLGMLQVGKAARPHLPFTAGDGTRLPFADDTFDAVTISFGLRSIVDPLAGLREMRRVTGRAAARRLRVQPPDLVALPHRVPRVPHAGAAPIARAVSSSPDAYVYLAESIRAWLTSRASPRWSPRPAGATRSGATCPVGSSPAHRATPG